MSDAEQIFVRNTSFVDHNKPGTNLRESNYRTFFRSALVDRSGQRPVLLAATAGGEVSLFIACNCFYATLNRKVNRPSKEWISLFATDVYCMMYCLAHSHDGSKVLYPGKGLVVSIGSM
jgi:hypothetical protein